ncbi:uncharacterized protein LOC127538997 [Antechinus flavipes]|uniref:uncharacterized protein LOC127538997 n=1 Tax=Antechinus flavipes TaxID=38775 RepID=UPI0022362132|nr:uncharacterized protein LOC127538997 [Antechinus flavipes]
MFSMGKNNRVYNHDSVEEGGRSLIQRVIKSPRTAPSSRREDARVPFRLPVISCSSVPFCLLANSRPEGPAPTTTHQGWAMAAPWRRPAKIFPAPPCGTPMKNPSRPSFPWTQGGGPPPPVRPIKVLSGPRSLRTMGAKTSPEVASSLDRPLQITGRQLLPAPGTNTNAAPVGPGKTRGSWRSTRGGAASAAQCKPPPATLPKHSQIREENGGGRRRSFWSCF